MKRKEIGIKDFIFHLQGDRVKFTPNTADPELKDMVRLWRRNHPEVDNDRTAVGLMFCEAVKEHTTATARAIIQAIESGRYEMSADDLLDATYKDVSDERELHRYGWSYVETAINLIQKDLPEEEVN